jgi:ferredoxin
VLPAGAPYGGLKVDVEACTLCMACVSACPADALLDNPERPQLRFIEAACVQCGLCRNTCPETAIALDPRFDPAAPMQPIVVKEEAPFECIRCGKPFASPSTIRRITERLAGKHWMFETDARVQLIQMCDDCRLQAQAEMSAADNPFAAHPRPRIRTTDDYLEADKEGLTVEDFLKKD